MAAGERDDGARLLLEALDPLGVSGHLGPQQLDRDLAVKPVVTGPVHLPHPARSERRDDLVRPEPRTRLHFWFSL